MDYLVIAIASVVIVILLAAFFVYRKKGSPQKEQRVLSQIKCPVCATVLFKGENIISKVYRPRNVPDQLCTISGCPHCFPFREEGVHRECPVCHKTLLEEEALTARLFNKSSGKNHIHILGCPHCRKSEGTLP